MKQDRGSFTIEATLVFPVIFLITIIIILGSLFIYRQVSLYGTASITAKRAAFIWDNSSKNWETGAYYIGSHDDLYWRIFEDNSQEISTNKSISPAQQNLSERKLFNAAGQLPKGISGTLTYENHWISRSIIVKLESEWKIPRFLQKWFHSGAVAKEVNISVNDPVEFIRNMDLVSEYLPSVTSKIPYPDILGIWEKFRGINDENSKSDELMFATHAEAKLYLQKLVKGYSTTRSTNEVGKWRLIDAYDHEQIAHQAY